MPAAAEVVGEVVGREVARRLPARRRPPGAIAEAAFLAACTRCMACVEACPHRAIYTLAPSVKLGAGTPVMVPDERPCHQCEGFPCAQSCEPRALRPPTGAAWRLGRVEVDPSACLPFRGPECGACAGLCPTPTPALRLRLGRPVIDADLCVGCGLCMPACPTRPVALRLAPLGDAA